MSKVLALPSGSKALPKNDRAERAILGYCLSVSDPLAKLHEHNLRAEDFYDQVHGRMFEVMEEQFTGGARRADVFSLSGKLSRHPGFNERGGPEYLRGLRDGFDHYQAMAAAKVVKDLARRRRVIETCTSAAHRAHDMAQDIEAVARDGAEAFASTSLSGARKHPEKAATVLNRVWDEMQARAKQPDSLVGISTSFSDLDRLILGLQAPDLVILAARPGMGKTALAVDMAFRAALRAQVPTAFFSLEMSSEQIFQRALCSQGGINAYRAKTGRLNKDDWDLAWDVAGRLNDAPVWIDDTSSISLPELSYKARALHSQHGIRLLVVDYIQLMRAGTRTDNREREIATISAGLKGLAKDLDIPIVALSQLNRDVEKRSNKRPTLADLRESGAIEQDADIILFLYRPDVYEKGPTPQKGLAEVDVAKHRNGATGRVELTFVSACTTFEDKAWEPQQAELPEW